MGYLLIKAVLVPILRVAYRIEVTGRQHVPRRGAVIVAANHGSFIDSLFIPFVMRRRVIFLAKAEYFEDRRVAWFFRLAGQIPIRREGGSASDAALAAGRDVLDAGGMLGIYPEGTRSPDGRLYKGRTGVARVALASGVPVLPVGLSGTAAAQPVGSRIPRPFRTVRVAVGEARAWPDHAGQAGDPETLRRVTDEVVTAIGVLCGQPPLDTYAPGSVTKRRRGRNARFTSGA